MTQLQNIVVHYAIRLAVVMAAWGIKAAAQRLSAGKKSGRRALPAARASKQPLLRFVRCPEKDYKPNNPRWLIEAAAWNPQDIPHLLPECPALTAFKEQVAAGDFVVQLGSRECREQLFALDPEFPSYLNHGSYGATFRLALEVQSWHRELMEQEPVRFMETVGIAGLVKAVADVAEFVQADWQDVVPVVNATSAVNAVVQSLQLKRGDLLLMSSTTYPAVRSTMARAAAADGAGLLDLNLQLEDLLDEERLVSCFKAALAAGGRRLKLVVVDHVVSFPPVIMPVQQICAMCRDAGVPVLVDGAHAVGCLPDLNVPRLGCDYYTTNLHKWLCTPKGAALLWVHQSKQDAVRPLVCSHGYGLGFRGEFLWQGTADFTAWLAAPASLQVMQALGPHRVARYNHDLVKQAAQLLQQAWGTQLAVGVGKDGSTSGMVAVQLPWPLEIPCTSSNDSTSSEKNAAAATAAVVRVAVNGVVADAGKLHANGAAGSLAPPTPAHAAALNKLLREQYLTEVPVACVAGSLWVRISAQIYNSLDDYRPLANAVLQLQQAAGITA